MMGLSSVRSAFVSAAYESVNFLGAVLYCSLPRSSDGIRRLPSVTDQGPTMRMLQISGMEIMSKLQFKAFLGTPAFQSPLCTRQS